jgi:diadenosine tetraphosphate (Ap4A) HIT family hydrolase
MSSCIFCDIVNGIINPIYIYQDELIAAFMDIEPINDGHILVIPKQHRLDLDELSYEEMVRIMEISKVIVSVLKEVFEPDGYSMMQNGGAFNDIGHYHMHIFPRYRNDGFGWTFGSHDRKSIEDIGSLIKTKMDGKPST